MNNKVTRHQSPPIKVSIDLLQPWSVPVMKTTLPSDVLQKMIKITDEIVVDENAIDHGSRLVGQIKTELTVPPESIGDGLLKYFHTMIKHFIISAKAQQNPYDKEEFLKENWLTQMLSMWIVSQQPGEYNPLHTHSKCHISAVMYLKVPKFSPSIKKHRPKDDGIISFISNQSTDTSLSYPSISIIPTVGDFFLFSSKQLHEVYPFRCEEGDPERRSVSFNAAFQSETEYNENKPNTNHSVYGVMTDE